MAMQCFARILAATVAMLSGGTAWPQESRLWTSSANGRQFEGTFVKIEGDSISIRRTSDNAVFQVRKADLIVADLDWIEEFTNQPAAASGALKDLSPLVAEIPGKTGVPAIGVLLVVDGETRGIGYSGVRKAGTTTEVEADDRWHLGSCTKSFTATLAATFVEEGAISWESTIGEILGKELKILEGYEGVTLGMLLANRSGITGNAPDSVYAGIEISEKVADLKDRDLLRQRAQYAEAVLNLPPSSAPGTAYEYSNAGFVVAGAMLEQVSGEPWEKLIEERIFQPLEMTHSGFGNAARDDKKNPSQPWPHKTGTTPRDPGPGDDNPWVIGPAGTMHCSLRDVGRYIAMHSKRELGPVIKKEETYQFLHTAVPDNNNYARGWIVGSRGWTQGAAISHDGNNTMNHCRFWIAPERRAAVAAFTNCDEKGQESCRDAIQAVVEEFLE